MVVICSMIHIFVPFPIAMSVNVITHSITSKHNNNNNNVNIVIVISTKIVVLFQTYYKLLKYIDSTHMAQCISLYLLTDIYVYTYYTYYSHPHHSYIL